MILVIPAVGIGAWKDRTLPIPAVGIGAENDRTLPKCRIHGTVMQRGSVPITYGLVRFSDAGLQYVTARASMFPNCDDTVRGAALSGQKRPC